MLAMLLNPNFAASRKLETQQQQPAANREDQTWRFVRSSKVPTIFTKSGFYGNWEDLEVTV
jgi:hypothetical protein